MKNFFFEENFSEEKEKEIEDLIPSFSKTIELDREFDEDFFMMNKNIIKNRIKI